MRETSRHMEFPAPTLADWGTKVAAGLKGAAFDSLVRRTADGIARGPLFTQENLPEDIAALPRAVAPNLEGRPWHVTEMIDVADDPATANHAALEALNDGASALWIVNAGNSSKRVLEGVITDLVPVISDCENHKSYEYEASQLSMSMGHSVSQKETENLRLPRFGTIDVRPAHETGGTMVDELVYLALQMAVYIRSDEPFARVRISVDSDTHLNIAKLRAARRIIDTICTAADVSSPAIHAVTSLRMMTQTDPWTNMLRTASASFAAVLGGATYITTRPFTDAIGTPTAFARSQARKQQLLMMAESHLGQVNDPAFGGYFHEALTDKLATQSWEDFQAIEAEGGLARQYTAFRQRLERSRAALTALKPDVLGVSLHPAESLRDAKVVKTHRTDHAGWGLPQIWLEALHD